MQLICNRTQNDAIWVLIALFLTNQIAGNIIDFKMNAINIVIMPWRTASSLSVFNFILYSTILTF